MQNVEPIWGGFQNPVPINSGELSADFIRVDGLPIYLGINASFHRSTLSLLTGKTRGLHSYLSGLRPNPQASLKVLLCVPHSFYEFHSIVVRLHSTAGATLTSILRLPIILSPRHQTFDIQLSLT
jgi:hypothetical protein